MKSLKQILAENMLRFNSKNLTDEHKTRILHEAATYDAMGMGELWAYLPTNVICRIGTPIDLLARGNQFSAVTPFTFTAVSFTPTDAGKIMGFDTKSVTAKGTVPAVPQLRAQRKPTDKKIKVDGYQFGAAAGDPQMDLFVRNLYNEMSEARWGSSPDPGSSVELPPRPGATWRNKIIWKPFPEMKIGTITPTTVRKGGNQRLLQNLNAESFLAYVKSSPAPFNKYKPDPTHFDAGRGVKIGHVIFNTNSQGSTDLYGGQVKRAIWFKGTIADAPGAAPVTPTTNPGQ